VQGLGPVGAPPSASITERGANARTSGAPPSACTTDRAANARPAKAPPSGSITAAEAFARTSGAHLRPSPSKEQQQGCSACSHGCGKRGAKFIDNQQVNVSKCNVLSGKHRLWARFRLTARSCKNIDLPKNGFFILPPLVKYPPILPRD
jgi:hypothetical protein